MIKKHYIALFSLFASFFALCVIGLGSFTRLIDAGLGCPDWPGCYGHFTVPAQVSDGSHFVAYKAWSEMIHRYFAGTLSLFILCIVIMIAIRSIRDIKKEKNNAILAVCILIAVIYQIILGQWTVTLKLLPIIVTQHLLGGFLILSILWLLFLSNKKYQSNVVLFKQNITGYYLFSLIGFFLILAQIFLGAWTSTNYASLSCPDFPFCINQSPFLAMNFKPAFNVLSPIGVNYEGGVLSESVRQTIQMTHRLGALIVTLYLFLFSIFSIRIFKSVYPIMNSIYLMLGLLLIQLCLGMTNVLFKLPVMTAVGHTLIAVLLLLTMLTVTFQLNRYRKVVLQ